MKTNEKQAGSRIRPDVKWEFLMRECDRTSDAYQTARYLRLTEDWHVYREETGHVSGMFWPTSDTETRWFRRGGLYFGRELDNALMYANRHHFGAIQDKLNLQRDPWGPSYAMPRPCLAGDVK
jgi:hypothetical protein